MHTVLDVANTVQILNAFFIQKILAISPNNIQRFFFKKYRALWALMVKRKKNWRTTDPKPKKWKLNDVNFSKNHTQLVAFVLLWFHLSLVYYLSGETRIRRDFSSIIQYRRQILERRLPFVPFLKNPIFARIRYATINFKWNSSWKKKPLLSKTSSIVKLLILIKILQVRIIKSPEKKRFKIGIKRNATSPFR